MVAQRVLNIDTASMPDKFHTACKLNQDNLLAITIKEFPGEASFEKYTSSVFGSPSIYRFRIPVVAENDSIEIPINSLNHNSCYLKSSATRYDTFSNNLHLPTYPSHFLDTVQAILGIAVTQR
jgi:hypothetical protein